MTEPTPDLRTRLAQAFSKAATAKGTRLGRLRLALADAALDVFDQDAQDKLLADILERTRIRDLQFRGGVAMGLDSARELASAWVAAARTMLGDAENYTETRVDFPKAKVEFKVKVAEEFESYVLTVQRAWKLTPHEARQRAEAERDEARAILARVERTREAMKHIAENGVDHIQRVAWTNAESMLADALNSEAAGGGGDDE